MAIPWIGANFTAEREEHNWVAGEARNKTKLGHCFNSLLFNSGHSRIALGRTFVSAQYPAISIAMTVGRAGPCVGPRFSQAPQLSPVLRAHD